MMGFLGRLMYLIGFVCVGIAFLIWLAEDVAGPLLIYIAVVFAILILSTLFRIGSWLFTGEAGDNELSISERPIVTSLSLILFWAATIVIVFGHFVPAIE